MSEKRDPRSFLASALVLCGYGHEVAEKLVQQALDEHAHELAEKIRRELPERVKKLTGNWAEIRTVSTAQHAADLIDPKKEGQ